MAGSFTYTPDPNAPGQIDGVAPTIGCYLFDPESGYVPLPNVQFLDCQQKEWEPATARFAYILDEDADDFPSELEDLWPLTAPENPYAIRYEDRIAAILHLPDGTDKVLFDGFVQAAQADVDPGSCHAGFTAVDVAIRCWDKPMVNRTQRDASDPYQGDNGVIGLSIRFNPCESDGIAEPNCTPDGSDSEPEEEEGADAGSKKFPVFLDNKLRRIPDPRTWWTLDKLVRHILSVYNDREYIENPEFDGLSELLNNRVPKPDADYYDPADKSTYDEHPIVIRDYDATGHAWPDALRAQLAIAGFGFRFVTEEDDDGFPTHRIEFYRKDAGASKGKVIHLPARGTNLGDAFADTKQLNVVRDGLSVRNAALVEVKLPRVEASFVLAYGFSPATGDESAANRTQYYTGNLDGNSGTQNAKYRVYVADEAGDGHWDLGANSWSNTPLDLTPLFPDDQEGNPTYLTRLRPGSYRLNSVDTSDQPIIARLALSRDYTGASPAVWDGTGHWQTITGGFRLLHDRLGIEITAPDPEEWNIGWATGPDPQENSSTLRGVRCCANPDSGPGAPQCLKRFYLRLTTTIEADKAENAIAEARPASPTRYQRYAHADGRDHFSIKKVAPHSEFNSTEKEVIVRDDSVLALAHATQLRSAHEFPVTAGAVAMPGIVLSINVGDTITEVAGRNLSFQCNSGIEQGEEPAYPVVVAVSWSVQGDEMMTTLQLSDRRAEPAGV